MSHYDKVWDKKSSRILRASFLKKELALFRKNDIKKVLDLGSGNGDNLVKLATLGYEVTGIELSQVGVNVTKAKLQRLGLDGIILKRDFYKRLPFRDSSFDAVYSYQALCHNRIDKIRKFLKECHRVLKDEGILSIKDGIDRLFVKKGEFYYMAPKLKRKLKLIGKNTYLPVGDDDPEKGVIHYEFSMKELVKEVEDIGFILISKRRLKKGTMGLLNFRKV